jgi:O-antigen ligase
MDKRSEGAVIGPLVGWTALLATLAVTPWSSYDPINLPKLAVIGVGGFIALGALAANSKQFFPAKFRVLKVLALAFFIDLILVLIISGTNTTQEFFGTNGRATGFVAYASLCSLLVAAAVVVSQNILKRFSKVLLIAGGLSLGYGLIQAAGQDPIKWINQYSPVIGFLGNPNFESSFVALSAVLAFSIALSTGIKAAGRIGYVTYVLLALLVVEKTNSQQGFLVFAGGAAIVALIWILKSRFKVLMIPSLLISSIGLAMATLGSLNSGPLAGLLYKDSVTYRGDYWRAGWNMALERPLFGVGLDSFGDWYRRTRTIEATVRRGPETISNAAHNVLIDFASNGGFPLLIIYLLLMILVIVSAVKLIKRSSGFDPVIVGLIAVWAAYQAQALISLNQLGLAVWGWIISGLIIGYEINTRDIQTNERSDIKKGRTAAEKSGAKIDSRTLIGMFTGLLVGALAGLPPLVASTQFRSALQSGDQTLVINASKIFPQDAYRTMQIVAILYENKLMPQALVLTEEAVVRYPDSFDAWKVLAILPNASPSQIAEAKAQMKRLDPHNPTLK